MKVFAENRKAKNSYEFLEFFEAGIVLSGPETKSIRIGGISIIDAFATIENEEAIMREMNIEPYKYAELNEYNSKSPTSRIIQFEDDKNNSAQHVELERKVDDANLDDKDRSNIDMNSINTILGSRDIMWGKPFRPAVELSNQALALASRNRRFISDVEKRGIRRKKSEQSGVCVVS